MRKLLLVIITLVFITPLKSQICLGGDTSICPGQSVTISALCSSGPSNPVFYFGQYATGEFNR